MIYDKDNLQMAMIQRFAAPADDTGRAKILAKLWQFREDIKESQMIQRFDTIHIYSLVKRQVDRKF